LSDIYTIVTVAGDVVILASLALAWQVLTSQIANLKLPVPNVTVPPQITKVEGLLMPVLSDAKILDSKIKGRFLNCVSPYIVKDHEVVCFLMSEEETHVSHNVVMRKEHRTPILTGPDGFRYQAARPLIDGFERIYLYRRRQES